MLRANRLHKASSLHGVYMVAVCFPGGNVWDAVTGEFRELGGADMHQVMMSRFPQKVYLSQKKNRS